MAMPAAHPLTINLGLGKTGTTTLHEFFRCNGWRSAHYRGCNARSFTGTKLRGRLCADAVTTFLQSTWQDMLKHAPPSNEELFRNATSSRSHQFDVYAQIDDGITCNLPNVFHLRALMSQASELPLNDSDLSLIASDHHGSFLTASCCLCWSLLTFDCALCCTSCRVRASC